MLAAALVFVGAVVAVVSVGAHAVASAAREEDGNRCSQEHEVDFRRKESHVNLDLEQGYDHHNGQEGTEES